MPIESCEINRSGRDTYRYSAKISTPASQIAWCQQVGQYDIWLTPYEVIVVGPPKRGTEDGVVSNYTYEHAGQRFPLIEYKILAMKAMIFGSN